MEKIAADLLGLAPEGFADSQPIGLVTTDSREVCPGCIFVAFPGERFDGHDFAAKALEEGVSVLNACTESGFPDYSSFLKTFRRLYGITPTEYRAQHRTMVR